MNRVCVFCGSNVGSRQIYAEQTRALVKVLVERRIGLVYGGGNIGLMGVLADTALAMGVEIIGVIPELLKAKELANSAVTQLHVVPGMHERKALMANLADAFIALPGGFGTLDELFEILTWKQLKLHGKPIGLLNVEGYFDSLLAFLDRAVAEGFIRESHRRMLQATSAPKELIDLLTKSRPSEQEEKWI